MHRRMKTGNTDTYRQVWEIQANIETYRLKMWKQRFVDLRLRNIYTHMDRRAGNTCIVERR
jgi:hypothetical protein